MSFVYDPADPAFAAQAHDVYRVLRDEHPVYSDPQGRFVALSRFDDVRAAALDWERFSSAGKVELQYTKPTLNSLDPPRHGQLRALLARAFTPKRVAELEPEVRSIASELVAALVDREECDAMLDFAALLPLSGQSLPRYFVEIGIGYLAIAAPPLAVGWTLGQRLEPVAGAMARPRER